MGGGVPAYQQPVARSIASLHMTTTAEAGCYTRAMEYSTEQRTKAVQLRVIQYILYLYSCCALVAGGHHVITNQQHDY